MLGTTDGTEPTKEHVVHDKLLYKITPPRKPIFDDDYHLTDEDKEAAIFIRDSYDLAEVVVIANQVLTPHILRPNVSQGFYVDAVSPKTAICINFSNLCRIT